MSYKCSHGLNIVNRFDPKILKYNTLCRISWLGQNIVNRFDPKILKFNALCRISVLGLNTVGHI